MFSIILKRSRKGCRFDGVVYGVLFHSTKNYSESMNSFPVFLPETLFFSNNREKALRQLFSFCRIFSNVLGRHEDKLTFNFPAYLSLVICNTDINPPSNPHRPSCQMCGLFFSRDRMLSFGLVFANFYCIVSQESCYTPIRAVLNRQKKAFLSEYWHEDHL